MNNEEKILEMLADMKASQEEMRKDISGLKASQEEMRANISEMQTTLTRVAVTQESVVLPKLQLLYEGHSAIVDHLDTLTPKSRTEVLEDDVAMLKDVVKLMRQEINELKKAQ